MAPLPGTEFLDAVGDLEDQDFAALVAAVWRARGATVTESGQTLEVVRRDTVETVAPVLAPWWGSVADRVPPTADVVVTDRADPEVPGDVRVVDGPALYGMVVYGIDRDRADTLCREFLGRPVTGAAGSGLDRPRASLAGAALVVLLVAAATLLAGPVPEDLSGDASPDTTPAPTETFGPPVDELPYSQTWPAYERSPAGPGERCFDPPVDALPYTEMRPDHDEVDTDPTAADTGSPPTPEAEPACPDGQEAI